MYHKLTGPDFGLTVDYVSRLSDYQIEQIYCYRKGVITSESWMREHNGEDETS